MPSAAEVAILLRAQDAASAVIGNTSKQLDALGASGQKTQSSLAGIGSAIGGIAFTAAAAGVTALVAGLGAATSAAMNFEKGLSGIQAVSGATAAQMDQIRSVALQLGKDTSFSAQEAAAGMEEIIKAGMPLADVLNGGARAALDLAAASGTAVPEAAAIMANAMNIFNNEGLTAATVADTLTQAANASATSVHDLGYSFSAVGAVAKTVGVNFNDTATALAIMAQNGLKGSDAGTSLKTMLLNLSPSSKSAVAAMRELGLITAEGANQFFDAQGKAKSLSDISQILQNSLRGLTKEQQLNALQTIFGTDAVRAAAIMAEAGAEGFTHMGQAMADSGDAQTSARTRLNNLAGSLEMLKGSLETAAIMLGSLLTPALKGLADAATVGVNQAIEVIERLPDIWHTLGQVLANDWSPSATIDPLVNAIGIAAVAFNQFTGIGARLQAFAAIVQRAMTGDVAGAFIQFIQLVGQTYTQLVTALAQWGRAFVEWIAPMIGPALSALGDFLAQVLTFLASQVGPLASTLSGWVVAFVEWVAPMIGPAIAALATYGAAVLAWIGEQLGPIAAQLLTWVTAFVEWVTPVIPQVLTALGGLISGIVGWIQSNGPAILAALVAWGQAFMEWVAPAIPPLMAALATLMTTLLAWVTSTALPAIAQALLAWGLAFMEWVGPAIPPMLMALADLATQLVAWLVSQVPVIAAQLLTWGIEFMNWVGPAGVQMFGALGQLLGQLVAWLVSVQLQIAAGVVTWAQEFGRIGETGAPEVARGLAVLFVQIETQMLTLPAKMVEWGVAAIKGFIQGFLSMAVPAPTMPSMTGGGGSGGGLMSTGGGSIGSGGAGPHSAQYSDLIARVSAELGEDPALVAAIMETEGSGAGSTSPAGARGLMQVMPNYVRPGENPFDPETSIRQGIRAIQDKRAALGAGATPAQIAGAYFGYGTDAGGMTTGRYQQIFQERYNRAAGGAQPMIRMPLGMGQGIGLPSPGMGGNGATWDWLGQVPQSLEELQQVGQQALASYTQMTTGITDQSQQMSQSVLTSVTSMGDGIITTTQDASGTTVSTVTDMSGNVTSQYAQLSNGVVLTMGDMANGVVTSVNDMGTGIVTTMQDANGNAVSTVTDLSGNVVAQYTSMATGAVDATSQMGAGVAAATEQMSSQALTSVTQLGTGVMTSTRDTAGNMITTITDMNGKVVNQYASMSNGTQLQMNGMEEGVLTTVTDLGDGFVTTMQDMSGNTITTVTDLNGNVVQQMVDMSDESISTAQAMEEGVVSAAQSTMEQATDSFASLESEVSGSMQATQEAATSAAEAMREDVVGAAQEIASEAASSLQDFASEASDAFSDVEDTSADAADALDELQQAADDLEPPDTGDWEQSFKQISDGASDAADSLKDIEDAAKDAEDAVKDLDQAMGKIGGGKPPGFGKSTASDLWQGGEGWGIDYDRLAEAITAATAGLATRNYSLTVNSLAEREPLLQDFAILESLAGSSS